MDDCETRLVNLLDFVLDGSCTDAQREEFARLLEEHRQLTGEIIDGVFIHSLLQWRSENVAHDLATFGLPGTVEDKSPASVAAPAGRAASRSMRSWLWAVSAAILAIAAVTTWLMTARSPVGQVAIAKIIEQEGVAWADASTALQQGRLVMPGRLETTDGSFTMQFRTGPVVHVQGAASMMIESDMLVHLDRGQATARVPKAIRGFTIKTPVINVIDQGTEFGVAARESGVTDIIVFEGKVDLQDSISNLSATIRLNGGEAARVDRQGAVERIMQVGRDLKGAWWTLDYPDYQESVIKEVRDNIPPSDGSKYFCYQVTFHGLADDAKAYCDRHPHEWNGLSARGLPSFLRGADYVKTFNDYRYVLDFEMVVELSRPANLYIFFDDRVPLPAWLLEQFEDTGVDIGLDEGPWEGIPDHVVRVGGGNSIDTIISVWHRRCVDTAPVVLGPVGETNEARTMYGIAATPLDRAGPTFDTFLNHDGT
jgi:hypothetical protein